MNSNYNPSTSGAAAAGFSKPKIDSNIFYKPSNSFSDKTVNNRKDKSKNKTFYDYIFHIYFVSKKDENVAINENDDMVPCEFCNEQFPFDALIQHQVIATHCFEIILIIKFNRQHVNWQIMTVYRRILIILIFVITKLNMMTIIRKFQ